MTTRSLIRRSLPGAAAIAISMIGLDAGKVVGRPSVCSPVASQPRPLARFASLPLRFEANTGQLDDRVRFLARGLGLAVFLTDDGATMALRTGQLERNLAMRVVGRTHVNAPHASERLATRSSYFLGNDPTRWRTDVPSFGRVTYRDVVPGVDQVFHGTRGALEYDLVVAPGVRPESIELAFDGADRVTVDDAGDLRIATGGATLVQGKPRVYQGSEGHELTVAAGYRVTGRTSVAFDIGPYDRDRSLVIDPVLAYATFLGGDGNDYGFGIAVDSAGAMYVAGSTTSSTFPTSNADQGTLTGTEDAFVTKLSPTGDALVYSTYLGGSAGAYGYGIAVDATGAAYVVGATSSADFPTKGGFDTVLGGNVDAFVAKLSPSGSSLAYSTLLGGTGNDYGYGIAVDTAGAAYLVGTTDGSDLPVVGAFQGASAGGGTDAFVAKVSPSGGALVYATYLGGTGAEAGSGIAVDSAGAAYVTGFTTSLDFPTSPATPFQALNAGNENVFVTKLAPTGSSLAYSTYLGGSQSDEGSAVAVDDAGAAYVTGSATSPDFPTASAFQKAAGAFDGTSSAFVTKMSPTGTSLAYSTFLGGSRGDMGAGVAVNAAGEAYVTGVTRSTDFPVTNAFQATYAAGGASSGTNAFVTRLAADGSTLVYSSYLGGSVGDSAQAIAAGPGGAAYVTGFTVSPDFPTVGAFDAHLTSATGANAFVAVVADTTLVPDASVGPSRDAGAGADGGSGASAESFGGGATESDGDASTGRTTFQAGGGGCSCRASRESGAEGFGWLFAVVGCVGRVGRRRS